MNLREFQLYVPTTMNQLGTRLHDEVHMVLGFGSELTNELAIAILRNDTVNISEELCDAEWFLCNKANLYGIILPDYAPNILYNEVAEFFKVPLERLLGSDIAVLHMASGALMDITKREFAYGEAKYDKKPVTVELREKLILLTLSAIRSIAERFHSNLPDGRDAIKRKLDERYKKKGFDANLALNRDTDAERKALEGDNG